MSRRLLAPLVVAAVVAGGTTAAALSWPVLPRVPGPPPPPTAAPVVERGLVCADVAADPGRVTTRASLAALPSPAGMRSAGRAAMTAVRGAATTPLPVLVGAGAVSKAEVARSAGPIRADAYGPLAAGVAAELLARIDAGQGRGLAETRCAVAAPDTWFVGGSTTVGSSASLLLVNPDEVVATADVSLMTAAGPVAPRSARGVEVPARGSVRMALESLAPNVPALATHVAVTAGRLTATMLERRHLASLALGVDYVAPTAAPARAAVVPGLLAGPGARSVLLAVPGPDDASVELRVVTTDGSFVPAALNAVRVRAGTVVPVDLAKVLAGRPAAVVVSSDVPVLAGGFSAQGDAVTHEAEFAWTAATPPLGGAALLPDNRVRGAQRSVLLLTAPEASATVSLTGLSAGPQAGPGPIMIRVPAGRTIAVPLQVLRVPGGEFALVVTPMPGSGPIYGSRQLSEQRGRGVWLSQLTLERTEVTASVPTVVQDPAAGVP